MGTTTWAFFKKALFTFIIFASLTFSHADHHLSRLARRHLIRRQSIPTTLPGSWQSLGCYTDSPTRTLQGPQQSGTSNTIESCITFCDSQGFSYAGTEYGSECYCGNNISGTATSVSMSECNVPCSGNAQEVCGAGWRMNLFWNGKPPPGWTSVGCYTDGATRTLQGAQQSGQTNSMASCTAFCDSKDFVYAGTEYGVECYCGNSVSSSATNVSMSECNVPCSGNAQETCGAGWRLNLFTSGKAPPKQATIPASIGAWSSMGCYTDNVNGVRTLPVGTSVNGQVTLETCTDACANGGYAYAGAEYSHECFCGNALASGAGPAPLEDCNMVCAGNSSEYCGGPNRLSLYKFGVITSTTTSTLSTSSTLASTSTTTSSSSSPTPVQTGWAYNACWVDNAHGRIFSFSAPPNSMNTVESCISTCTQRNYTVAGMQYGAECYCANQLINGATQAPEADCSMPCAGNLSQVCGGPNRATVYSSGPFDVLSVPAPRTTGLPSNWIYKGCLREPSGRKIFPYQIIWPNNNTALACVQQCYKFGYSASGVEYGNECYCGDVSDVVDNNGVFGEESECNMVCPGDPGTICGSGNRLTTYYYNGTLNDWHRPANIGRYEFFVPGVVVPLIATVGLNNKVTFLEKHGTGPPNSTGAYELDLSLVNNFGAAWREMHVKSDVFCAGSVILPDKAGRQLNVGGWSLDATYGVRLFTPDGVEGVNSTNDWEENFQLLKLQRARWYPTAAVLANGSVLVMGGEVGANAAPQPNLEILPKPEGGDTVVDADYLSRTDPFSLYPFVNILPSERIFVAYYNEARILDPVTFATVVTLPNIPGAVNDFTAGRSYPLEGASVPLPQMAPYTDPLEILICGGSTITGATVLDNCVTTAPEAPNPIWIIERMPSRRVMPCLVSLPDGTIMIMNGAKKGTAGFALAEDPNLNAVLYDPSQPRGSRFSILNDTIVPRMYHSEATLLPDGRILVSGSDPQTNWPNGTVKYPQEFRIEVYIPPYLNNGFAQPTFTVSEKDWAYGGTYTITDINLPQDGPIRVSLVAATSSTHGNTMGARTIFPETSFCTGVTCVVTAPPNAGVSPPGWYMVFILDGPTPSHSQWVRIGGDPAQLGNWPQLPGFTAPGL